MIRQAHGQTQQVFVARFSFFFFFFHFLRLALVRERAISLRGFHACLVGDFFFRLLLLLSLGSVFRALKGKSMRSSSWPLAVVFRSSKWTDTHHPGQPISFDSLLASFNELFISVPRLSSKFCPPQQPAGAHQLLKDGFSFLFLEIEMKRNGNKKDKYLLQLYTHTHTHTRMDMMKRVATNKFVNIEFVAGI
jgi:hypothetical protein